MNGPAAFTFGITVQVRKKDPEPHAGAERDAPRPVAERVQGIPHRGWPGPGQNHTGTPMLNFDEGPVDGLWLVSRALAGIGLNDKCYICKSKLAGAFIYI